MTLEKLKIENKLKTMRLETNLKPDDLIMPFKVIPGNNKITAMTNSPHCYSYTLDKLLDTLQSYYNKGLKTIILSAPTLSPNQNLDIDEDSLLQKAIRNIKQMCPKLEVITVLDIKWLEKNDAAMLNLFIHIASTYAEEGADAIIPRHLESKNLKILRNGLDEAGFTTINLISDVIEYDSAFCTDLTSNSIDSANNKLQISDINKALNSAKSVEQNVDALLIQPAGPMLDILKQISQFSDLPIIAFQVGAEYEALNLAIKNNILNKKAIYESLIAIKRAGAYQIITYFTLDILDKI